MVAQGVKFVKQIKQMFSACFSNASQNDTSLKWTDEFSLRGLASMLWPGDDVGNPYKGCADKAP